MAKLKTNKEKLLYFLVRYCTEAKTTEILVQDSDLNTRLFGIPPFGNKEQLQEIIDELLKEGLVCPVYSYPSDWRDPILKGYSPTTAGYQKIISELEELIQKLTFKVRNYTR